MSGDNRNMAVAKQVKNDEFYTRLEDVEAEMRHYVAHFKGARVLCNCDDPFASAFVRYFADNFDRLGLKGLVSTCWSGGGGRAYRAEITHVSKAGMDMADLLAVSGNSLQELSGDGDFRSDECLRELDAADVIVTNPPFSLFREYVSVLMERGKRFAVIGNRNASSCKEFFPLLRDDRLWVGETHPKRFLQPDGDVRVLGNICWFTNLDIGRLHASLPLTKRYHGHEDEYPVYDGYDAIEVSRLADIPYDYPGVMGVPIMFFDRYSPDQFEILAMSRYVPRYDGMCASFLADYFAQGGTGAVYPGHPDLGYYTSDGKAIVPYRRVLVRNRFPVS